MDETPTPGNFSQHYLTVQALTATEPSTDTSTSDTNISLNSLTNSVFVFTAVLIVGIVAFLATKFRNRSYLSNTFKLGFALALIPLSLGVIGLRTQLTSKAGPDQIPTNIQVTKVTSSSFSVSFQTKAKTSSAVKIGDSSDMSEIVQIKTGGLDQKFSTHNYSLDHLSSNTTYYLEIYSDGIWYDNSGHPLTISTSP